MSLRESRSTKDLKDEKNNLHAIHTYILNLYNTCQNVEFQQKYYL